MSENLLRRAASLGLHRTRALWRTLSGSTARTIGGCRGQAAILMYHRILPDGVSASGIEPGMFVRASAFERQLDWLSRHMAVRTLGQLLADPPPADSEPVAVLTFDDGWRDNLTEAWPLLQQRSMSATLFAVRDWCRAGRHAGGEFIRPDELREMADQGLEVGAHTVSHPRLDQLSGQDMEREMRASREAVEEWTGRTCDVFAYPYGAHDAVAVDLASRIFRGSVLVQGGWWRRGCESARLPRIGIHQDMTSTSTMFASRIAGAAA